MYFTVKEVADYLSMSEPIILHLVHEGKIRAVHDGEQFVINIEQFNDHFDQLEKVKQLIDEWKQEPIPEDPDVKDED
ncbi:hypothetical protein CR203_02690 [Salipaludibacillus neizhouensis]|uniref:Helix-turn-helix domain-containing protein n=1 Tax=Salipaludibacillus neizhouensis TaxID=885475 RepID=A0A3A9K7L3_9BACI|nr:excisionase family DNA-binding protein [Salipaludibacillus neizhouensis]RKL68964.1 hypothetical protein CR203_02690 [Salipaludibacillus neizhouensis]